MKTLVICSVISKMWLFHLCNMVLAEVDLSLTNSYVIHVLGHEMKKTLFHLLWNSQLVEEVYYKIMFSCQEFP